LHYGGHWVNLALHQLCLRYIMLLASEYQ